MATFLSARSTIAGSRWFALERVTERSLPLVADLAESIWWQCYPPIIGARQVHYMLGRGYALPSLRRDLHDGNRYFILRVGPCPAGFFAWRPQDGEAFLDKLYLEPAYQGLGLGQYLLAELARQAERSGLTGVFLRVNRRNTPAIRAYRRAGFSIRGTDCKPIGGGFVMDDYLMWRPGSNRAPSRRSPLAEGRRF
jgi:GNAT superfamily N-acetyltransferase